MATWKNPETALLGRLLKPLDDEAIKTIPILYRAGFGVARAAFEASANPDARAALAHVNLVAGKLAREGFVSVAYTTAWADLEPGERLMRVDGVGRMRDSGDWHVGRDGVHEVLMPLGRAGHLVVSSPMELPRVDRFDGLLNAVMRHYEHAVGFGRVGWDSRVATQMKPGEAWSLPPDLARLVYAQPEYGVSGYILCEMSKNVDLIDPEPARKVVRVAVK